MPTSPPARAPRPQYCPATGVGMVAGRRCPHCPLMASPAEHSGTVACHSQWPPGLRSIEVPHLCLPRVLHVSLLVTFRWENGAPVCSCDAKGLLSTHWALAQPHGV